MSQAHDEGPRGPEAAHPADSKVAELSRNRLIEACQQGGVTLVLGAGISLPRGIPSWYRLVERLWGAAFPRSPLPEVSNLPQFLPLALDLISRKLDGDFPDALKSALYQDVQPPDRALLHESDETLAVLARLLVREYAAGGARRILRVITFNVDDLVENATWTLSPHRRVLKLVSRASHHPERGRGDQSIPIYHLHGFLPHVDPRSRWFEGAADFLVFTDSQYWSSVASPMSFANRVMSFALHDSRCLFIGCSMTDINLLRWLAIRANEIEADKEEQFEALPDARERSKRAVRQALERHFWIHAENDDPTGFLGRCLTLRGIRGVPLDAWGTPAFRELMADCFPPDEPPTVPG